MLSKILGGLLLATVLALGTLGYLYRGELRTSAALAASLKTAVDANATNQHTIDRLEADQVIAQASAIADAQERAKLETETDALKKAVASAGEGVCPGLDALIRERMRQRQGGGPGANP